MKQMKRIIGILLSIVLIFGTIPIAADNVSAATTSSYSPYAKIEYSYSPNVSCGTIRYITQVTGGSYFNWNYWPASPFGGYAAPESECGTASISMALSYIGISKTPREILEAYNGYTQFIGWGGSTHTSMSASSISTAMSNYINGKGKYSPPVIHLPGYSSAGHYVVVIGHISANTYQILDPWNQQVTSMTINGTSASYSKGGKTINDRVDQLHQWYNPNDVTLDVEPPTISNVRVTDVTNTGYTITCDVSDNIGVTRVQFPAWPDEIPEELAWYEGTINGNVASCRIDISNHGNRTNIRYATHIYAYDAAGNLTQVNAPWAYIDGTEPIISNVQVSDITSTGYTVTGEVSDDIGVTRVRFPAWPDEIPEELAWYEGTIDGNVASCRIDISNHGNKTNIRYATHIYAYDAAGNLAQANAPWAYIEEHKHSYTVRITKQPTCTDVGLKTYSCDCGDSYTESIAATGHIYETIVAAPSCTGKGYSTHTCKTCGDSYTDNEKAALGHKYGNWTTVKSATCESAGSEKRVCERCSNTETRSVAAKGHTYETVVTEPSCTGKGYSTHTCKTCGDSYTDNEKAALGHKYGNWTTVKSATCESAGSEKRVCERCSNTETRSITAKGHAYETVVTAPGCETTGYSTHTCKTCGDSYTDSITNALGHKLGNWTTVKEATCEESGSEKRSCERCDYEEIQKTAVADHNYKKFTTLPTCEESGYTTYTCRACGYSYDGDEKEALGHSFTNYISDNNATGDFGGTKTAKCDRCNATDTIPETSEEVPENPVNKEVIRLAGNTRYDTGYAVANVLKETLGGDKFEAVVVATGKNFADALAGSYLAVQKNAPIILTNGNADNVARLHEYIKANVRENGTVYILGGEAAVPESVEDISGYTVKRLAGSSRYDTNLEILLEAGISGDEIIVATGKSFADSLSASAAKLPILLVKPNATLDIAQKALLKNMNKFYIVGGEGAVSSAYETELAAYGMVERVFGSSRYDTSVEIAKAFSGSVDKIVVASGKNFPDGLCGGPLAAALNVPLILTRDNGADAAMEYAEENAVVGGYVLGGTGALTDDTVVDVFKLESAQEIK